MSGTRSACAANFLPSVGHRTWVSIGDRPWVETLLAVGIFALGEERTRLVPDLYLVTGIGQNDLAHEDREGRCSISLMSMLFGCVSDRLVCASSDGLHLDREAESFRRLIADLHVRE